MTSQQYQMSLFSGQSQSISNKSVVKIGNVNPSGNGMNGEVYQADGLAPTLTTNKGEGQKIAIKSNTIKLFEGIAKDKSELIYDALGDIQVVLIGLDQQIKSGAQISANQQELELLLMVSSLGNIAQKLYSHVCHNETQMPLIKSDLMFLDSVISSVSLFNGTDADSCLQIAYAAIKDRKGKMVDRVFVKEEDLG